MTHFMTLATFSVRSQADVAPQAQFIPMITMYYVLSISYAFIALIWFIVADHLTTKQNIPKFLVAFAAFIKRILFWIFDEEPIWKSRKVAPEKKETEEALTEESSAKTEANALPEEKTSEQATKANNCFTCDFCGDCRKVNNKEIFNKSKQSRV
jgi:hypothetical protein